MTARTLKHIDDGTADLTENAATLTANGSAVVVMSVQAQGLGADDLVLVIGQFEATNPLAYNVGVTRSILRATSAVATTGVPLVPAVQENVTPDTHHMASQIVAVDTGATGTQYYNLVLSAVAGGGNGNLTIEQGYGKLQTILLKR